MFYQALLIQTRSWIDLTVIYTYYQSFLTTYCYFSLLIQENSVSCLCFIDISWWRLTNFFSISYYDTFIVINILIIISFWMYQLYSVSFVFYWYLAGDWSLSSVSVTIPLSIITGTFSYYYSHSNCTFCYFFLLIRCCILWVVCFIGILLDTDHFLQYQLLTPLKYSTTSDSLNRTPDNYTFINNLDAS